MNVYDLINLNNIDIEESIKDTIFEVRNILKDLNKNRTCKVYSSYITDGLRRRHIVNRIVDSKELDCLYSHQFNLVPCDGKDYYLIDLTYEQFNSEEFPELIQDGYIKVDDNTFNRYLDVVGMKAFGSTLDDAFNKEHLSSK